MDIHESSSSSSSSKMASICSLTTENASKFMEIVSDDTLVEILLRLPDSREAIRSSAVCKRWCSIVTDPHFRDSFVRRHSNGQYSDFSILFKFTNKPQVPLYQLRWRQSEHLPLEPFDLSFMPNPIELEIKASCADLLLVARIDTRQYYVCNSVTSQWTALPEIPPLGHIRAWERGSAGYALACDPQNKRRYKAVVIHGVNSRFRAAMYDSHTGLWTLPCFKYPGNNPNNDLPTNQIPLQVVFAGDGTLHWLDGIHEFRGIAEFDPFNPSFRLIPLPAPAQQFDLIGGGYHVNDKIRLGVVRGRLRLSRMHRTFNLINFLQPPNFVLKIWELDVDNDSWISVHDAAMEIPGGALAPLPKPFFVLSFDPRDGSVVFVVAEKELYRYHLDEGVYERVWEFPVPCFSSDYQRRGLTVLDLVCPYWPTPIPY